MGAYNDILVNSFSLIYCFLKCYYNLNDQFYLSFRYSTAMTGKWHLGWDKDSYGDNLHGPLGHGFESFFGLPFTFVDGFERYIETKL